MPVLGKETSILPDDLFRSDCSFNFADSHWWVLHTRPRAEKAVARRLSKNGTPFFLPLFERRYRRQRRLIRSLSPLFPSYVFMLTTEEQRSSALTTNPIANCMVVHDEERLFKDLRSIYQLIESNVSLAPEERLKPGMSAEIVSGPLKGYRGTVVRRGRSLRLVMKVDFLQRGASVEVDTSDLRPL